METNKLLTIDLSVISENVVEIFLIDSSTDPSLFNEIAKENTHRPEILNLLVTHPLTPEDTREFAARTLKVPVPAETTKTEELHRKDKHKKREKTQNLLQRVQGMKMGEKMQLALKGSREIRSILIRDTSSEISMAVLKNPKMTDSEIELLAKQKSTEVDTLREIAKKREWMKSYSIVHCLVTNPKTPIGIALKHIHTIRTKDLKMIEKDRNIPEAVRVNAKKLVLARK